MVAYNKQLWKSCEYLYNNDRVINHEELKKCQNMFQNNLNSLNPQEQSSIIDNTDQDLYDPINGLFEKCKNQDNRDVCLNELLRKQLDDFEEKLKVNERRILINKNREEYDRLKSDFEDNKNNINRYYNQYISIKVNNMEKYNALNRLKKEFKMLYTNYDRMNSKIADYKEKIINNYNSIENTQYENLIMNYKLIDINNKILNKLENKIKYSEEINRIENIKYNKNKKYFKIMIILIISLIIINSILLVIYFKS